MTPEQKIQVAVVYIDLAIEAIGRVFRIAVPIVIFTALLVFMVYRRRSRR